MRIRRKKHLKERLLLVKDYLIVPERDIANVKEAIKDKKYFDFKKIFNNSNPIELEIGCGKGGFVVQKAKENPDVNFVAVEMLENIIVMAAELAQKENLKNVVFINSGAEYLPRYIEDETISNIYLNFSPPYPQNGYEERRLTCQTKILAYKTFLKHDGAVYQKTDDKSFFEYSFEQFNKHGFKTKDVSRDIEQGLLHNVATEYENKFRSLGLPIYALVAKKQ